jgi:hypothetical protein
MLAAGGLAVALTTACSQGSLTPASSAARAGHTVYRVSLTVQNPGVLPKGSQVELLDPATDSYREAPTSAIPARASAVDVGNPRADERTAVTSVTNGVPALSTTLIDYPPQVPNEAIVLSGLPALRAYLGYQSANPAGYAVGHVAGHVRLTWAFPSSYVQTLRASGLPAPLVSEIARSAAHARIVMTVLSKSTVSATVYGRLFGIDAGKADTIMRTTLAPAAAPRSPSPSYWLGATWRGQAAGPATIVAQRGTNRWMDSYTVSYGADDAQRLPDPGQLTVTTTGDAGLNRPPGGLSRRAILLADGTVATLYYHAPKPHTSRAKPSGTHALQSVVVGHASAVGTVISTPLGRLKVFAATVHDDYVPSFIYVSTGSSQIVITVPGPLTLGQRIRLAEALRRI